MGVLQVERDCRIIIELGNKPWQFTVKDIFIVSGDSAMCTRSFFFYENADFAQRTKSLAILLFVMNDYCAKCGTVTFDVKYEFLVGTWRILNFL